MTTEKTITARVVTMSLLADSILAIELRRSDGALLPPATPGAHIDLHLQNGLIRQYSLTTAEGDPASYIVAVKRDRASRGGSSFVHDHLRVGDVIEISAPRNNFPLDESASCSILIAGGIGITPILSMMRRLRQRGASFELHYSCRKDSEVVYAAELSESEEIDVHLSDEFGAMDLEKIIALAPSDAHFYCCGPVPMIEAFEAAASNIEAERIHVERFTNNAIIATEGGYLVKLQRDGRSFVIPQGQTILSALREAGIEVSFSCEQGICGSCETAVVSGKPDHRDSILTEAEREANATMMICCSGSHSDVLVLDL